MARAPASDRRTADARALKLLEGPILTSLITLAAPIMLMNILQSANSLIDAFWVGRLGAAAVAAVSVSFPIMFLSLAAGAGFATAGSTLIAQYFGARKIDMVSHVAAQSLLMVTFVALVLGVIGFLAAPGVLHLMGVISNVHDAALGFMRVSFCGIVFSFSAFMFQAILRAVGETTIPILVALGSMLLNFALNPVFIFGWGPIPAFGVMGSAMTTVLAQALGAAIVLGVLLSGRFGIHLRWDDFKPDFAYFKRAFFLGAPASVEMSMRALGMTVLTFIITGFGTLAIASYGVVSNVLNVVIIPAMGLSMAVATLAGQNIGAGNINRAGEIGRLGAVLGFGMLTAFGVFAFAFAHHFIAFFVPNDSDVIENGARLLRIMCLFWGCIGIQFALTGVLRASGNMMTPLVISIVSQWVLQFPLAYVLSANAGLGVSGVWWAFPVTNVVTALITVAVYLRGDWKKKRLIDEDERLIKQVAEETLSEEGFRQ
jgi:putative MATE family efflux protein